jgi:hypothetical protein
MVKCWENGEHARISFQHSNIPTFHYSVNLSRTDHRPIAGLLM